MIRNQGNIERVARILVGLVLLGALLLGPKSPWGLIGLFPLVAGLLGWCPLYQLVGCSTCHPPAIGKGA